MVEEWQSCTWSEGEAAGQKSGLPEVPTLSLMREGVAEKAAQPKALVTGPGSESASLRLRGRERRKPRYCPDLGCAWAGTPGPRRMGLSAHHATGSPGHPPLPMPSSAQPAAPCSRLAICGAVPQGTGDLAEGGPVLGAGRPAALHQPIELGRAALGLWQPGLPSLQICRSGGV